MEVPLHELRPGIIYSLPSDRIVQRALFPSATPESMIGWFAKNKSSSQKMSGIIKQAHTSGYYTHVKILSAEHAQTKCLYAVLLNTNNIRLLTKCDAALLSFRYTSYPLV